MTPKQMIEAEIAEFEKLAESSRVSSEIWSKSSADWVIKNPYVAACQIQTALAAELQAKTLTMCANRLRELLKLKGW